MAESKFKRGQTVICIGSPSGGESNTDIRYGGMGWRKGLKFKIWDITHTSDYPRRYIYWAGRGAGGVFEEHLKLVEEDWDK